MCAICCLFCVGVKLGLSQWGRVFEGRVLREIFGAEKEEVTGDWRKVRNEELHDLYCSPGVIRVITLRRMAWVGHVARMGEKRDAYKVLVCIP